MKQAGFWDWEERQNKLNQKQDLLVRLNQVIPLETFRPLLGQVHEKPRKSNAGRKPIDVIVMFKLLVLQQLYNISLLHSPLRRETLLQGCALMKRWSIRSVTACPLCSF